MTLLLADVIARTIIEIPVQALPPSEGAVATYYHVVGSPDAGVKVFQSRRVALARWRVESLAGVAGLGPPVLSPVRELNLVDGWGYLVRHATPWRGSDAQLRHAASSLAFLAGEAGLTIPPDLAERNLGVIDDRVVLIDWGNDDQPTPVGRRRRSIERAGPRPRSSSTRVPRVRRGHDAPHGAKR